MTGLFGKTTCLEAAIRENSFPVYEQRRRGRKKYHERDCNWMTLTLE